MSEKIEGGSASALASHSKDASVDGPPPASSRTGEPAQVSSHPEGVGGFAGQVREAVGQAAASVSDAAGAASKTVSQQSARAADEAMDFVREQPLVALMVTGAVCFILGMLIPRR